jgi:high-affinity Fe2+/Pb2+ permease
MSKHLYVRAALAGAIVGAAAGVILYWVLRAAGYQPSTYLLIAVVVACIPGSVMLSLTREGEELDEADWRFEARDAARDDS